ncbi:MAG TPA: hypothetical protein VE954_05865 [Oligoflexus sp.]|uniref:hypothetical protein n=1 Tax=Oligoflexus sp. TaxID=1971216 RepID=UPI002D704558|nr:hypothetical protein [Oligoflexus sp.]HYX32619.1 hypothetical protein [Oligoflexus sp.]
MRWPNLLIVAFAATQALTFSKISKADSCESIASIPGVTSSGSPPIVFKKTDFANKAYGISPKLFYGDWDWRKDFSYLNLPKSPHANEAIAAFAARCLTAFPAGRIHTGFLQQTEADYGSYLNRIFDEVVAIKRELLLLQQSQVRLLDQYMPTETAEAYKPIYRENMKKHLNDALLQLTQFVDTHYIYTIEGMSSYFTMEKQLAIATSQIYELIALVGDVPDADKWALKMLKDNTYKVLDTYGLFFSSEQKGKLAASLEAASKIENEPDLGKVKKSLEDWALSLEESMNNAFNEKSSYFTIALKIKFLFGTRDPLDEETAIEEIQARIDPNKTADVAEILRKVKNDSSLWQGVLNGI